MAEDGSMAQRLGYDHSDPDAPRCPVCGHTRWRGEALGWRVESTVRRALHRPEKPNPCGVALEDDSSRFGGEVCGCVDPFHSPAGSDA